MEFPPSGQENHIDRTPGPHYVVITQIGGAHPMLYAAVGNEHTNLSREDLQKILYGALDKIPAKERTLIIPPDMTRLHSRAGELTELAWQYLGKKLQAVIPALGTHFPMSKNELKKMYGHLPLELIKEHNWRCGLTELGRLSGKFIREISGEKLDYDWPVEVNRILIDHPWDLILSIGQVVPHEVVGMANYTKNIMVGVGGKEAIDKSHFLGAVCGMERIMGRSETPVRQLFDRGADEFCKDLPIVYVLTVVATDEAGNNITKGIFIGDDRECYEKAAELSRNVNIKKLEKAPKKVVVYLEPEEFRSTWLGNKSIYRTRMAMADRGELIVLAPGVHCFGENETIDKLIRRYGYRGTEQTLKAVKNNPDLAENLSAAAHLIHGSSEGRFTITYCPGGLSREEIEKAGYQFGDLESYRKRYNPEKLKEGWNTMDNDEEIYFISNPALGLWVWEEKFL